MKIKSLCVILTHSNLELTVVVLLSVYDTPWVLPGHPVSLSVKRECLPFLGLKEDLM